MGRDVYLLRFMLSCRSNGETQIFNFSAGLSLSRRSNSEELTRFRTAADTAFQNRPFLCNRMQQKNVLFSETYSFGRNLPFDFMYSSGVPYKWMLCRLTSRLLFSTHACSVMRDHEMQIYKNTDLSSD